MCCIVSLLLALSRSRPWRGHRRRRACKACCICGCGSRENDSEGRCARVAFGVFLLSCRVWPGSRWTYRENSRGRASKAPRSNFSSLGRGCARPSLGARVSLGFRTWRALPSCGFCSSVLRSRKVSNVEGVVFTVFSLGVRCGGLWIYSKGVEAVVLLESWFAYSTRASWCNIVPCMVPLCSIGKWWPRVAVKNMCVNVGTSIRLESCLPLQS